MKNPKSWKHTTKNHKAYGEWHGDKYNTPFMDTTDVEKEDNE